MSGRPAIPVFQYSKTGEFIRSYSSIQEVRINYFPLDGNNKRPIFSRRDYEVLRDGTIITKTRIGRVGVLALVKRLDNPFIKIDRRSPLIELVNIDDQVIATFKDINIASKLTNINYGTILHQLKKGSKHKKAANNYTTFRYKK